MQHSRFGAASNLKLMRDTSLCIYKQVFVVVKSDTEIFSDVESKLVKRWILDKPSTHATTETSKAPYQGYKNIVSCSSGFWKA